MPYLRVVKGAVNFIVMFLSFGVDSRDVCSPGHFFRLRDPSQKPSTGFRWNTSHKGKESSAGVPALGTGRDPFMARGHCLESPLWVPPPTSNRSVHLIFLRRKYKRPPSALGQPEKEVHFRKILDSQCPHSLLFSLKCTPDFHKFPTSVSQFAPHFEEQAVFMDAFSFHAPT